MTPADPAARDRPLSTGEAMYRAICADPADDTARLAYADYLDGLPTTRKPCPKCASGREPGWVHCHGDNGPGYYPCRVCTDLEHGERRGSGTVPDTAAADLATFIRVGVELARLPVVAGHLETYNPDKATLLVDASADRPQNTLVAIRHENHDNSWFTESGWRYVRGQYTLDNRVRMELEAAPALHRERELRDQHGSEWSKAPCPACGGGGTRTKLRCDTCGGTGDLLKRFPELPPRSGSGPAVARPLTFARGFVESVTVPTLAELVVEGRAVCPACGAGVDYNGQDDYSCPRCGWRGPGVGPAPSPWLSAVVRAVPLTRVVPADAGRFVYPASSDAPDRGRHFFIRNDSLRDALPLVLFDTLESDDQGPGWKRYSPRDAAVDALGKALGKALAAFGRSGSR